jgi:hypothetical protein
MFDWQAELAPPAILTAFTTSGNSDAVAIVPTLTHNVSSAPFSTHVQSTIPKPTFAQALRGCSQITTEPLPLTTIREEMLSISISTAAYS